jgi:hypothetical protein
MKTAFLAGFPQSSTQTSVSLQDAFPSTRSRGW